VVELREVDGVGGVGSACAGGQMSKSKTTKQSKKKITLACFYDNLIFKNQQFK